MGSKYFLRVIVITCMLFSITYTALAMPTIAVLNFENRSSVSSDSPFEVNEEMNAVSEYIMEGIVDTGRFDVVERVALDKVVNEMAMGTTGIVDPQTAAKVGRLVGAKYLVYGSITNISVKPSMIGYYGYGHNGIGVGTKINTVTANVVGRVIDVETGRIVFAMTGKGSSTSTLTSIGASFTAWRGRMRTNHLFRVGSVGVSQESVHNALQKAGYAAVDNLMDKIDGKHKKRRR